MQKPAVDHPRMKRLKIAVEFSSHPLSRRNVESMRSYYSRMGHSSLVTVIRV
jgi:hypothetical protein